MSAPIRVLHMIGSLNIGGSQTMVINLHKAIDKSKVQFDYVIDRPDQLYYADIVKQLGGKIFFMPTFKGFNFFEIRKAWKKFFREHPEYKILHSHVRSYASLYLPIARKAGLKTIIHSHNTSNGKGLSSLAKRVLQYPLRFQADHFFACSKEAGSWLFGKDVVNGKQFNVLKNAIDAKKFLYSDENRLHIRNEFNLHEKFVLGHIGRLTNQKNHSFLIDIFAKIHNEYINSSLLIIGNGELENFIKDKVQQQGLTNAVVFAGSRDDIPALLSAMDVFVFPSLWEGLGIVAIEAQASGLHAICSDAVPKEVEVTNLVDFLPLSQSAKIWADYILKYKEHYTRLNMREKIIEAGYDIHTTAKWLQDFYQKN